MTTAMTSYQQESLDKFLALPGVDQIIQNALAASSTGDCLTFETRAQTMAFIAIGDDALMYYKAIEALKQTVGIAKGSVA